MKNANRIPETFQTDAEYRQWMERWQQEAREATIEGFKQNRKLNGMTQTELGRQQADRITWRRHRHDRRSVRTYGYAPDADTGDDPA